MQGPKKPKEPTSTINKNRLCSKTCGIGKIFIYRKDQKRLRVLIVRDSTLTKAKTIHSIQMGEIPPRREIRSRNDGSNPEEKSGHGVTDPTPKRNLVKKVNLDGSHPEENYGWEIRVREQGSS